MRRILLIDDTPEIAELLTFALRDLGHQVFAQGYTDAVNELVVEHHPDVLVLDCSAYDMSEGLFDIVRQHPNHGELPIVIITDTPELADPSLRTFVDYDASVLFRRLKHFSRYQVDSGYINAE